MGAVSAVALLALVTVSIGLFSAAPQAVRAWRTRDVTGVSAGTVALTLTLVSLWFAYGLLIADPAQLVNNGGMAVFFLVVAAVVAGQHPRLSGWEPFALVVSVTASAYVVGSLTSPALPAAVGTLVGVVAKLPQVRLARSGAPLWGLCPWSTLLSMLTLVLWVCYGAAIGDAAVVVSAGLSALMQAVIVRHRLPLRRTVASLAAGRLGHRVAVPARVLARNLAVAA